MTEKLQRYLQRAEDSLESGMILLNADKYRGAVSLSYYAIYHSIQGMLSVNRIFTDSPKGQVRQFSNTFIKTKLIDKRFEEIFWHTHAKRQFSDHNIEGTVTKEEAELTCTEAKEFVEMARNYFLKA